MTQENTEGEVEAFMRVKYEGFIMGVDYCYLEDLDLVCVSFCGLVTLPLTSLVYLSSPTICQG